MVAVLKSVYYWLGEGAGATALIVGIIAFIGALAGVITSYIVAGRSVYINSITTERSKWIEKLRVNLAAYSGQLAAVALKTLSAELERGSVTTGGAIVVRDELEKLNHTAATIQLQLNPWGAIDENILALINTIVVRKTTDYRLIDRADKMLIAHSQWLLKAEWEKVKYEAHGGLHRWWHNDAEEKRIKKYQQWATGAGAIDALVRAFDLERAKGPGG